MLRGKPEGPANSIIFFHTINIQKNSSSNSNNNNNNKNKSTTKAKKQQKIVTK
jgi:hypothetical protein